MTRIQFCCDRCGKRISGLHTSHMTGGFYVMEAWEKYRSSEDEHFVCDNCIWNMPEYQADYPLAGVTV